MYTFAMLLLLFNLSIYNFDLRQQLNHGYLLDLFVWLFLLPNIHYCVFKLLLIFPHCLIANSSNFFQQTLRSRNKDLSF